jgi:hypothetical protein
MRSIPGLPFVGDWRCSAAIRIMLSENVVSNVEQPHRKSGHAEMC